MKAILFDHSSYDAPFADKTLLPHELVQSPRSHPCRQRSLSPENGPSALVEDCHHTHSRCWMRVYSWRWHVRGTTRAEV